MPVSIYAYFCSPKHLNITKMKKGIHPESYRLVAFKDMSDIEGVTYPLVKVEISNTSHPFYTGKMKLVDTAGRVDKFYQRYKNRQK